MDKASRVISGTWGEVWLDDVYVGLSLIHI